MRSALGRNPVGERWLFLKTGVPGGVQAIREDRILHEAHASGGDILRIGDLFGLSVTAAALHGHHRPPRTGRQRHAWPRGHLSPDRRWPHDR